jgi:eukaryotic-like serine/threonine-protein kinase
MCPDQATLRMYLDEALPATQLEELTAHVDSCWQCQKALDNVLVANSQANIVDRIRAVTPAILDDEPEAGVSEDTDGSDSAPPTQMLGAGQIAMVPRFAVRPSAIPGYDIEGEIGRGGMGVVYRAVHRRLGRTVALKMILGGGMIDPRIVQRFLFEAEILARVRHPQIVQVYEMSITSGQTEASPDVPYIAMELLEGGTLAKAMHGRRWTPREAATLVEGLARALHAIHTQGIIHRDIKPANILATEAGVYKLTDFGLAKASDQHDSNLTATGVIMGTPNYMSPEQAAGSKFIGPATDVYALGAILFELLAGRPPFEGGEPLALLIRVAQETPTNVRSIRSDVPLDLAAITMKCLSKEPERRYSSAEAFANDLERFLTNRPTRAKNVGSLGRLLYWSKRNPAMAAVLSALALVLVVTFLSVLLFWRNAVTQAKSLEKALGRAAQLTEIANENAAKANQLQAERTAANAELEFDVAVSRCERGDMTEGIEHFLQALRLAKESNNSELERVIRANLAAWSADVPKVSEVIDTKGLQNVRGTVSNPQGTIHAYFDETRIRVIDLNTKKLLADFSPQFPPWSLEWILKRIPIVRNFVRMKPWFHCAAISTDSSRIVLGNHSGLLFCFKINGQFERTIRVQHPTYSFPDIWAISFVGKNELWVCGTAGMLHLYDYRTGKLLNRVPVSDPVPAAAEIQPERITVMSMDIAADGKTIVMGDRIGRVQEWSIEKEKPPVLLRTRRLLGWVNSVAYSKSGKYLAATGTSSRAVVWDRHRNEEVPPKLDVSLQGNYGGKLSFSDNELCLAVNDLDTVRMWCIQSGTRHGRTVPGLFGKFIPQHNKLIVTRKENIAIYDVPEVFPASGMPEHLGQIRDLAFSPDGTQLAVIKNGLLYFRNGLLQTPVEQSGRDFLNSRTVKYSRDGTRIVVGLSSSWAVIDRRTGIVQPHVTHFITHHSVGVDPTCERIWILSNETLQCWSNDGKTQVASRVIHAENHDRRELTAFVHVPARKEIVLWNSSKIIIVPDDLTKTDLRIIPTNSTIRRLVVSRDGTSILTGHRDGTLQLLDYDSGKPVHQRRMSHTQDVSCMGFSADETRLVSGSRDGTVQIWDRATALPLGPRIETASAVMALATSGAHNNIAIGTSDGVVQYAEFVEWNTHLSLEELESWFESFQQGEQKALPTRK